MQLGPTLLALAADLKHRLGLSYRKAAELAGTYTDNARLAKRLREHRGSLFAFLRRDGVESTNNLAELEVRPAVTARELSAGNRTEEGAETHSILASVLRACRRRGTAILRALTDLLKNGPGHVLDLINPQPSPTR